MARIVLVHGAFAGGWCWEPALPGLRAAGHDVETLDLPGAGEDRTPVAEVTLDAYAAKICQVLGDGPPALLAGQSMGGMAITQAAAQSPQAITRLLYIGAFCPAEGQSLMDLVAYPEAAGDQVQANLVVEGDPPVGRLPDEAAKQVLFNTATPEDATWAAERLGPQPVVPFAGPISVPPENADAFAALPRAYIVCGQDRAIPPAMQRRMLTERGCDPVIEMATDHWPWMCRTEEFVAAVDRVAAATPATAA
jgi:pimeloyl-ACP methyl ester carboxylesterase